MDPGMLRVLMGVEEEYLEAAFAVIAEQHGSIDGYLRDVLGLDDALRGRLRDQLVEA
jgi:protein-tyrosine phosphatase